MVKPHMGAIAHPVLGDYCFLFFFFFLGGRGTKLFEAHVIGFTTGIGVPPCGTSSIANGETACGYHRACSGDKAM